MFEMQVRVPRFETWIATKAQGKCGTCATCEVPRRLPGDSSGTMASGGDVLPVQRHLLVKIAASGGWLAAVVVGIDGLVEMVLNTAKMEAG